MADPYQNYGQPGHENGQAQYNGTGQQTDGAAAPPPPTTTATGGGKKKRAYAGQAFDIASGANTVPPSAHMPSQTPQNVGYGYQQSSTQGYQQPSYGVYGDQGQGQQMPSTQQYGQQPAAYNPQAAYPQAQPAYGGQSTGDAVSSFMHDGAAAVTQQMGQMGLGAGQQPQQQPLLAQPRLNPLQPVDISPQGQGQPFQASDLDLPPPPLILPQNVCVPVTLQPAQSTILTSTDDHYPLT